MLNATHVNSQLEIQFSVGDQVQELAKGHKNWQEMIRAEIPVKHELYNERISNDFFWFK